MVTRQYQRKRGAEDQDNLDAPVQLPLPHDDLREEVDGAMDEIPPVRRISGVTQSLIRPAGRPRWPF